MNDQLRAAAQAVLDRWDSPTWEWAKQSPTADLMAELRAALAQQEPVEPVAWANIDSDRLRVDPATGTVSIGAQQEPVEPVAWVRLEAWKSGQSWPDDCFTALPAEGLTPLYTAPPQRKPLTEEEIWEVYYNLPESDFENSDRVAFARAVERAHGIGEEK